MDASGYTSVFTPLDNGQIRLLQLEPGPRSAPLVCRFEIVPFADDLHYEAVSYAWGSPDPEESAILHGQRVVIRKNLQRALLHLRHEKEQRTFWVDALCVNQAETDEAKDEKTAQVKMMGAIFHMADRTCIWLGDTSERDNVVVDYLCTDSGKGDLSALPIEALHHFFSRPWFQRLWILQEALLSKQPIAQCGERTTDFNRIVRLRQDLLLGNLGNAQGDIFEQCYLKDVLQEWDNLKDHLASHGGWPLVYALRMTEKLQCALLVDRIFALLGLATESDRRSLEVNYNKPLTQVQLEVCAHIVKHRESYLAALHFMGMPEDSELPSWARDWTQPKKARWHFIRTSQKMWTMLPNTQHRKGYKWLDDQANARPWRMKGPGDDDQDLARYSKNLQTLALKGIIVDCIMISFTSVPSNGEKLKEICKAWRDFASKHATAYESSDALHEAFGNAFCLGRYRDKDKNSSANCAEGYEKWIEEDDAVEGSTGLGENKTRPSGDFGYRAKCYGTGRALIITKKGFLGLAPEGALTGDVICFFKGCADPFILRPQKGKERFRFLGETHVPGIMDGEWLREANGEDVTEFWIE